MKIVLFGANGFLGSVLRKNYSKDDGVQLICHSRQEFSLEDPGMLWSFLNEHEPSIVINAAATVGFSKHIRLSSLFSVNTLVPSLIAQWSVSRDCFFVHLSTSIIHGSTTEFISQDSAINPDTPYAQSKILADRMISASGVSAAIIRCGGIWGTKGPAHLGINRALEDASNSKKLTIIGGGG